MIKPKLELIDLGKFVNELNSSLDDSEGYIDLGKYIYTEPNKNTIPYRSHEKKIETKGECSLIQTVYGRGVFAALFGVESEVKLGSISIETGYMDMGYSYENRYEFLKLNIDHPLELKKGNIIPKCRVRLRTIIEGINEPHHERRDHVRRYGFFWVKRDLSKVLPNKWFLK